MQRDQALAVLGLPETRSEADIESAYRERMRTFAMRARQNSDDRELRMRCKKAAMQLRRARAALLESDPESCDVLPAGETAILSGNDTNAAITRGKSVVRGLAPTEQTNQEGVRLSQGQVLANRYEIQELIGRGKMGDVFRAFDRVRHEMVALKVMKADLLRDNEARERFESEARIASKLSHPNVVRVFDLHQSDELCFLTMELLEGHNLREEAAARIRRDKPLKVVEILHLAGQLCDALEHAHAQTVHRDVRPENIWVGSDGSVKLMDFGIARVLAQPSGTAAETPQGTACYVAPEQLAGDKVDGRADQYSLSVVLYELLTGAAPQGAVVPVHRLRSGVSSGVSRVIMRGLSSDPAQRFGDMGAFRQALVRKRFGSLPIRSLASVAAVLLGLLLAWRLSPNWDRRFADDAQATTRVARDTWQEFHDSHSFDLGDMVPPAAARAEYAWEQAATFYEEGEYQQAAKVFTEAESSYAEAEIMAKRFLQVNMDEHLQKYRELFPEGESVPEAFQIPTLAASQGAFQKAMRLKDERKFEQADELYEDGVDALRQAATTAKNIARYHADWEAFAEKRNEAERLLTEWRDLSTRWKQVWTNDASFQNRWEEYFGDPSVEPRFRTLTRRIATVLPRDVPGMTKDMTSLCDELRAAITEARAHVRDIPIRHLSGKVNEALEQFVSLVKELKVMPEEAQNEVLRARIRRVTETILTETGAEASVELLSRASLEAESLAANDPLAAVQQYVETHADVERALARLKQARYRALAEQVPVKNPFLDVTDTADLPIMGSSATVDLGRVDPTMAESWSLSAHSRIATALDVALGGEPRGGQVSLGRMEWLGEIRLWPLRVSYGRQQPKVAGYVFVENGQLRFRWDRDFGNRFHPLLAEMTLMLKQGEFEHDVQLRQVVRSIPLPIDFNREEQKFTLPLPGILDQQRIALRIDSIRGLANAGGLPQLLAVGENRNVYLDDSKSFYLRVMFRSGEQAPEIRVQTRLNDGFRDRSITIAELAMLESDAERNLAEAEYRKKSAEEELEKIKIRYSELQQKANQIGNSIQGLHLQFQIKAALLNLETRANSLNSTINRCRRSLIPRWTATRKRLGDWRQTLEELVAARPSIDYRVVVASHDQSLDLVVSGPVTSELP